MFAKTLLSTIVAGFLLLPPVSAGGAGPSLSSLSAAATHCSAVPQAAPKIGSFNAGTATGTDDFWLVGYRHNAKGYDTLAEHWNGTSWSRIETPNPVGRSRRVTVDMLTGIAAVSPGSAWAIGSSTAGYFLLRWN